MKLEQTFLVNAPLSEVWSALIDVERVAPCLPGAEITETAPDGVYRGSFSVKLGPTAASYRGSLRLDTIDEATHTAAMQASGQDKRGQGGTSATITSRLSESDGATRVEVVTDLTITGRLARFGRGGMIEDISNRLMRDFADCLAAPSATALTRPPRPRPRARQRAPPPRRRARAKLPVRARARPFGTLGAVLIASGRATPRAHALPLPQPPAAGSRLGQAGQRAGCCSRCCALASGACLAADVVERMPA